MTAKKIRVAQWAAGRIGQSSMRAVIRHNHLELVSVKVHSADKVGVDAGTLCGLEPIGLLATDSIDAVINSKPDCVLYMPEGFNVDELTQLLNAGINIITTRNEFFHAPAMDDQLRERVQAACFAGQSTIHATGSSPGFITEALPAVLVSLSRSIQSITIDEYADIPASTTPEMITEVMGFGGAIPQQFDARMLEHSSVGFSQSLRALSESLGMSVDSITTKGEFAAAQKDFTIPGGGIIEQGTLAAMRMVVTATTRCQSKLVFRANWYCSQKTVPDFSVRDNGWRVCVDSDTPMNVTIDFPRTDQPYKDQMSGLTAHRAVNSIFAVCSAKPGIANCADLGAVIAQFN